MDTESVKAKPGKRGRKPGQKMGKYKVTVTDDMIADALEKAEGRIYKASEFVDLSPRQLFYRVNGCPHRDTMLPNEDLQEIIRAWKEIKLSRLEDSVLDRAMESDTLAIFTLKAQRGWKDGRELTVSGPNGGAIPIAVVQNDDWNAI